MNTEPPDAVLRKFSAVGERPQTQQVPAGPAHVYSYAVQCLPEQALYRLVLYVPFLEIVDLLLVVIRIQLELRPHRVRGTQRLPDEIIGCFAKPFTFHRLYIFEDQESALVDKLSTQCVI